jgi:hypothetical protein
MRMRVQPRPGWWTVTAILPLSFALACADPPPVSEFQVQLVAEGTGTVAGAAGALSCTLPSHAGTCHFEIETGTDGLTVTATPAPGFLFTGWRPLGVNGPDGAVAACPGSDDPVCELPVGAAPVVLRPRFEYPGVVEVAIVGEGTVRSTTHACGEESGDQERCRRSFPIGTEVALKASGDGFGGWGAPCYDAATTCTLTAAAGVTTTAYFQQAPPVTTHVLRVLPAGAGAGRVRSSDDDGATIDCVIGGGAAVGRCGVRTPIGASVPVTVTPEPGSIAYGVAPAACQTGACSFTLDQDHALLARFEPPTTTLTLTGGRQGAAIRVTSVPAGMDCSVDSGPTFTCGPVAFPFGTEVEVRLEAAGSQPVQRPVTWRSCTTGNGYCALFPQVRDQTFAIGLTTKQQVLTIVKEGEVSGGNIYLELPTANFGAISTTWPDSVFTQVYPPTDTGAFVRAEMRLPDSLLFVGWSGVCAGTGVCEFRMHGDKELRFRVVRR